MADFKSTDKLLKYIQLSDELHQVQTLEELSSFIIHKTLDFIDYDRAIFWQYNLIGKIKLTAISGTHQIDPNSPRNIWIKELIASTLKKKTSSKTALSKSKFKIFIQENWPHEWEDEIFWCTFNNLLNHVSSGVIFIRKKSWSEPEQLMAGQLLRDYQYSYQHLSLLSYRTFIKAYRFYKKTPRKFYAIGLITFLIISLVPVSQSVTAPAEVIAKDPRIMTSPLQSLINTMNVKSGQLVEKGQVLFTLDSKNLESARNLEAEQLRIAQAQYDAAARKAAYDHTSQAELGVWQAKIEEQKAKLDYSNSMLDQTQVLAPVSGIVNMNDAHDWEGQPVNIGDKILTIAQPNGIELEIWLPVSEGISFKEGSLIKMHPNGQPLNSYYATLINSSYSALVTPEGILSHRLIGFFKMGEFLPIGTHGSVKLYGHKVPMIYYLFRKPLSALRQAWG